MIEISIDEFVTFGNEVYKCVEYSEVNNTPCSLCDINSVKDCDNMNCSKGTRSDFTEVMFTLFDNTSENCDDSAE